MADMVDLKHTPSKSNDDYLGQTTDREPYYSISIYLEKDEINKLGLSDQKVGAEFDMTGHYRITSVSTSQSDKGKDYISMTATLMSATPPAAFTEGEAPRKKGDLETAVYGKKS